MNKICIKKIIIEAGVEENQRLLKLVVKKRHLVKSSSIVKFLW